MINHNSLSSTIPTVIIITNLLMIWPIFNHTNWDDDPLLTTAHMALGAGATNPLDLRQAVISDILLAIELYMGPCIYSAMVAARDEAWEMFIGIMLNC